MSLATISSLSIAVVKLIRHLLIRSKNLSTATVENDEAVPSIVVNAHLEGVKQGVEASESCCGELLGGITLANYVIIGGGKLHVG